jgi:hypothetical protein
MVVMSEKKTRAGEDEIRQIYKKLVQRYFNSYPKGNPLWVLNKHVKAYEKSMWKTEEPAIVDLACARVTIVRTDS